MYLTHFAGNVISTITNLRRERIILVSIWTLAVIYLVHKYRAPVVIERGEAVRLLSAVIRNADETMRNNAVLGQHSDSFLRNSMDEAKIEPSIEYEELLRGISKGIDEIANTVEKDLRRLQKLGTQTEASLGRTVDFLAEMKRSLKNDVAELKLNDGYEFWRNKESVTLSTAVQTRLQQLQSPANCNVATRQVCQPIQGCGEDELCNLEHVLQCFLTTFSKQHTMILDFPSWEKTFQTDSGSCSDGKTSADSIIPIENEISRKELEAILPQVTVYLDTRVKKLHDNPVDWWLGQFLNFLLRPLPATQTALNRLESELGFQSPIVGLHIRETDVNEATLERYMEAVNDYFAQKAMIQIVKMRKIFLDSNDPKLFQMIRAKYNQYDIIGDPQMLDKADLKMIFFNLKLLSRCDLLLCDKDTKMCRLSYSLMQTYRPDASDRMRILNDIESELV